MTVSITRCILLFAAFIACDDWDVADGAPGEGVYKANGSAIAGAFGAPLDIVIVSDQISGRAAAALPSPSWSSAFRSASAQSPTQRQQQQAATVLVSPLQNALRGPNQKRSPAALAGPAANARSASGSVNARCVLYAVRGARQTYVCYPQPAAGQSSGGRVYYLETGVGERPPSVVYASTGSNVLSTTPVWPRQQSTPRPRPNGGAQNGDSIVISVHGWNSDDGSTLVNVEPSNEGGDANTNTRDDGRLRPTGRNSGIFQKAAVSTDSRQCSQVARHLLQNMGANAVDAAVAIVFCLGLTIPQSTGIGGGFFMVIHNQTHVTTLDSRETAPARATRNMFSDSPRDAVVGARAVATPASVKGLYEAHRRFGRVEWARLIAPSIAMCETGFTVEPHLALKLRQHLREIRYLPEFGIYLNSSGQPVQRSEVIRDLKLCGTYKRVAERPQDFWEGDLAQDIEADLRDQRGIVEASDLRNYRPIWKEPLTFEVNGYTFYTMKPPSSGVLLALAFNILNEFKWTETPAGQEGPLFWHRLAEIFKHMFAKRSALGDDQHVNLTGMVETLKSKRYARGLFNMVDDTRTYQTEYYDACYHEATRLAQVRPPAGSAPPAASPVVLERAERLAKELAARRLSSSTSESAVVDDRGMAVSITSTVNGAFGSQVKGVRTGILFNNEMDDFSIPDTSNLYAISPSPKNFIVPGKRPTSSMSPTIVTDRDTRSVKLLIGSEGGPRIITAVTQAMFRTLWLKQSLTEAISAPRIHHQLLPPFLDVESGLDPAIVDALRARGHAVRDVELGLSVANGILRNAHGAWEAVSDFRKGGEPDGY